MAQNQRRMVYSKIWVSEQFGRLSDKGKLLFIGTITLADDDGRLIGNPSYLRGQVFPYDENITVSEVSQFRNEIEKSGLLSIYSINNCEYIQHPKWTEYQIIRKDLYKESALPSRNVTVTSPLQKRATSKDKISKDNLFAKAKKPLKNKPMQTWNEETGEWQGGTKKKPKPNPLREPAERLLTAYYTGFKKQISPNLEDMPPYPKARFLKEAYILLALYKEKELIDLLEPYFENEFYRKTGWSVGTFLNIKVINSLKQDGK